MTLTTYDFKSETVVTSGISSTSILFGAKDGQADTTPDPIAADAFGDYYAAGLGFTTLATGALSAARGGSGQTSYAIGDLLYASGAAALSKLADVATGNALISGGVGVAPAWGKIALTTHVSGRLPLANLVQGSALSVLGVTGNATADEASIAGTASQFLGVNAAGTALAFQTLAGDATLSGPTLTLATNVVTDAKFRQGVARSIVGVTGNATANTADIQGTASQFLGINAAGTALAFQTLSGDATLSGGALTVATNAITDAKFRQGAARSVVGVTGNATANTADIQGSASQFLGVNSAGTALAFQTLSGDATLSGGALTIAANAVTDAKFRQGVARSVVGVTGNATANTADIQGTANQVLVVNSGGTALAFGAVNLASASAVTGLLALANGGTNANLTASNGGIFYSTASAGAILAGTATANQMLLSGASGAPAWSSTTHPATIAAGDILYGSATNVLTALAKNVTATRYLSNTGASNIPAWAQIDLTNGVTGTLPVGNGGTGVANPTSHDLLIGAGSSAMTQLAPSATSGVPLISQGASADPAYGTAVVAGGGTGIATATAYSVICAGTTATGAFQSLAALGASGTVLTSNGAGALPSFQAVAGTGTVTSVATTAGITGGTITGSGTLSIDGAFGLRNRLINPSGQIAQTTLGATADGAYTGFDQWLALTQTGTVAASQVANAENGTPYMMRLTQSQASAQRFGLIQPIEKENCIDLRGKTVTLSARVRMSASTTLRYAIVEWTGTADSPTKDVVNDWTSGTFTTGNFFISTTTTLTGAGSIALTANTLTDITVLTAAIGSSANNLHVFFWTDSTQAQNVTLDIGRVQLEVGSSATALAFRSYGDELRLCQRYLPVFSFDTADKATGYNGQAYSTTHGLISIPFPVPARVKPTGVTRSADTDFALTDSTTGRHAASAISINNATVNAANLDVTSTTIVAGNCTQFWTNTALGGATASLVFTGAQL